MCNDHVRVSSSLHSQWLFSVEKNNFYDLSSYKFQTIRNPGIICYQWQTNTLFKMEANNLKISPKYRKKLTKLDFKITKNLLARSCPYKTFYYIIFIIFYYKASLKPIGSFYSLTAKTSAWHPGRRFQYLVVLVFFCIVKRPSPREKSLWRSNHSQFHLFLPRMKQGREKSPL